MVLQATFEFQNPDSTQDMNDRWSALFGRGIFSGGTVTPVSGELQVITSAFKGISIDGMMIEDTSSKIHTVVANEANFVVALAKYSATGAPTLSYLILSTTDYNAHEDKDFLIVFARIDVPLSATEVVQSDINLSIRDETSPLGRDSFRGIFATSASLPAAEKNALGDWALITQGNDTPEIHVWNTVAWVNATPSVTIQTELTNHRNDVFADEVHLTNDQADAVVGTTGTPSSSNLFVTSTDPQIPTQVENDALIGTQGVPSATNPFVSSEQIIAVPLETEFGSAPTPANRVTIATGTTYFVGTGAAGTSHQWFSIYSQNVNTKGILRNSSSQPVGITGIFTDTDMLIELDPSTNPNVDGNGFYSSTAPTIYGKVDNNIDSGFRLSFGTGDDIGTAPITTRIDRGPKTYFVPVSGADPTGAIAGTQDTIQALFQFKFNDRSDVFGRYAPNTGFDASVVHRRDNIFRSGISMEEPKTQQMSGTVENFTGGWTPVNVTVTIDNAYNWIDIKGASKFEATGAGAEVSTTADTISSSTAIRCYSIYAKAGTATNVEVRLDHVGGGTTPTALVVYDLVGATSDASGSPDAPVAHGLDYASQGWYRCWVSIASDTANTSVVVGMNPDADDTNGYSFWDRAQLELGSYPTGWISQVEGSRTQPTLGYDADFMSNVGSISLWARRSDLDNSTERPLLWNDNSSTTPVGPALMVNQNGNLAFFDLGTGIVETSTTTAVNNRNWHHYVYDYGNGKIWYDGNLVHDAADAVVEPNVAEPIHIGTAASSIPKKWNGEIAEVLFESGTISQDTIDGRVTNGQKGRLMIIPALSQPTRHYNVDQYAQDVHPLAISELFLNPISNVSGIIHFADDASLAWNEAGQFEFDRVVQNTDATDATSDTTGSLQTAGGISAQLDIWGGANLHLDGTALTFEGADVDRTITFATGASLAWVEAGVFDATLGDFTFSKPLQIALDTNTLPAIVDEETGLVISNASATDDNVNLTLVAGATGNSRIHFGDTDSENAGILGYDHDTDILRMVVAADVVVDFAASATETISLHSDSNQDGGIAFASDARLFWDEIDGWRTGTGDFTLTKPLAIVVGGNTPESALPAQGAVFVVMDKNSSNTQLSMQNQFASGQTIIIFGDEAVINQGSIAYLQGTPGQMFFSVQEDRILTLNASTTATVSIHDDADQDGGIQFATGANLLWEQSGGWGTGGNFVLNNQIGIDLDGGTIPTINLATGLVISNTSDPSDDVFMSLITGATGLSAINFGDDGTEFIGRFEYDQNGQVFAFYVETTLVMTMSESQTATINLSVGPDSGIQFGSDANLLWHESADEFEFNKDLRVGASFAGDPAIPALKTTRSITGVERAAQFQNDAAASLSNEVEIVFSLERTTSGETVAADIRASLIDIGAATADGKMEFSVALDTVRKKIVDVLPTGITVTGDILPEANDTRDVGSSGFRYNTMWAGTFDGTASSALYSDLAEKYTNADGDQPIGTLVSKTTATDPLYQIEVTKSDCDIRVVGVVSANPGFGMNESADAQYIARVGMVPVRCMGPIVKGDFLVSSKLDGVARAGRISELAYKFGWADETDPSVGEKLIKSII